MTPTFAPAYSFARQFGAKCLIYGPPGMGKTPILNTAPRPVLCISEPGMLSMRNSPIMACEAMTAESIADFYRWFASSAEVQNYDTVGIDSISQQAEIILAAELKKHKDPRKAYGELSRIMMEHINSVYYARNKHVYLICKETKDDATKVRIPYFPGQDLNVKVPHLFDEILHLDAVNIPQVGAVTAFRCHKSDTVRARDRSGNLAEFEQPNLTNMFNKIMQ